MNHLPVTLGVANSQNIVADCDSYALGGSDLVRVTLSHDYARAAPAGWLGATPAGSYVPTNPTAGPQTILAGTTIAVTKAESDALIGASVATLAA